MALFGEKMSTFLKLLSIWGIIQLSIQGFLLYIQSVAFAEDIGLETVYTHDEFVQQVDEKFFSAAISCWVAAGLFVLTLGLAIIGKKGSSA